MKDKDDQVHETRAGCKEVKGMEDRPGSDKVCMLQMGIWTWFGESVYEQVSQVDQHITL